MNLSQNGIGIVNNFTKRINKPIYKTETIIIEIENDIHKLELVFPKEIRREAQLHCTILFYIIIGIFILIVLLIVILKIL